MDDEPWYSARCIFEACGLPAPEGRHVYEERIVLIRADSDDEAMQKAERFAEQYAAACGFDYLGHVMTYHMPESVIGDGTEVFSLMRTSPLGADDFIRRYFSDGTEHARG